MVSEFEWPRQWAEHWVEVTSKQDVGVCPLECIQRLSGDGGEQGQDVGIPGTSWPLGLVIKSHP